MKTKIAWLWITGIGLVLFGCEHPPVRTDAGPGCTVCTATVTVTSCESISVSPDPIVVAQGEHDIDWTISGNADFTSSGITFKSGSGKGFSNPNRPAQGQFRVHDANTVKGRHHYTVEVSVDGRVCRLDPDVLNN